MLRLTPRLKPFSSAFPLRKIGARHDSIVVRFFMTSHMWQESRVVILKANMEEAKKRNKMLNLATLEPLHEFDQNRRKYGSDVSDTNK